MPIQDNDYFGWQGFGFPIPADYAPLTLTGNRREGYARLGSSSRLNIQIRWRTVQGKVKLRTALDTYLDKLKRDAKKAKEKFNAEIDEKDGAILYRYTGMGQGRGKLFVSEASNRLLFLEVVGARKDQLLPTYRLLETGIADSAKDDWEVWSLLGLRFRSPVPLSLERKLMQAGRTQLVFRSRSLQLEADRWGFGEQLIKKHGISAWAQAALQINREPDEVDACRVSFGPSGLLKPVAAIARYDESKNQIITLKATTRKPERRPTWDWLDF